MKKALLRVHKCFYEPLNNGEPDHMSAYRALEPYRAIPIDVKQSWLAGMYQNVLADIYGNISDCSVILLCLLRI